MYILPQGGRGDLGSVDRPFNTGETSGCPWVDPSGIDPSGIDLGRDVEGSSFDPVHPVPTPATLHRVDSTGRTL